MSVYIGLLRTCMLDIIITVCTVYVACMYAYCLSPSHVYTVYVYTAFIYSINTTLCYIQLYKALNAIETKAREAREAVNYEKATIEHCTRIEPLG